MFDSRKFRRSANEVITARLVFAKKSPDEQLVSAESPSLAKKIRAKIYNLTVNKEKRALKLNIKELENEIGNIELQLQQLKNDLNSKQEHLKTASRLNLVRITSKGLGFLGDLLNNVSETLNPENDPKITPDENTEAPKKDDAEINPDENIETLQKEYERLQLITKIKGLKKELEIDNNRNK